MLSSSYEFLSRSRCVITKFRFLFSALLVTLPAGLLAQQAVCPADPMEKQVSVDGGLTWHDADSVATAPELKVGATAYFRFVITNCGDENCYELRARDIPLGIGITEIGDGLVLPGQQIIVDHTTPGFGNLEATNYCTNGGVKMNFGEEASKIGDQVKGTVNRDDAWVDCVDDEPPAPEIELCTVVTLDCDGDPDMDADMITGDGCDIYYPDQSIPTGVVGVEMGCYALKITNNGDETLKDIMIDSPVLDGFGFSNQVTDCGELDPDEMCILTRDTENFEPLKENPVCVDTSDVVRTATVTGTGVTSGIMVSDDDPATVYCEEIPPPPLSCDDGKPIALTFEYTGGACEVAPGNPQEGKFTCSGTPGAGAVQLTVESAFADPSTETINVGDFVTVTADGKFDSQTDFTILQGGQSVQDISVHLSCSKPINVGDRFGALTLRVFTPGDSGGGMGGMGGMDPKPPKEEKEKKEKKKKKDK